MSLSDLPFFLFSILFSGNFGTGDLWTADILGFDDSGSYSG
jgi:hypothetical protein